MPSSSACKAAFRQVDISDRRIVAGNGAEGLLIITDGTAFDGRFSWNV